MHPFLLDYCLDPAEIHPGDGRNYLGFSGRVTIYRVFTGKSQGENNFGQLGVDENIVLNIMSGK
jgi:hypothetical protein